MLSDLNQESRTNSNPTAGGLGSRPFQGSCLEPGFQVSENRKCSIDKAESWQFTLILDQFAANQFTWMWNSSGSIHIDVGAALGPSQRQAHSGVAVSSPSHRSHVRDPTAEQQLPEPQLPGFASQHSAPWVHYLECALRYSYKGPRPTAEPLPKTAQRQRLCLAFRPPSTSDGHVRQVQGLPMCAMMCDQLQ